MCLTLKLHCFIDKSIGSLLILISKHMCNCFRRDAELQFTSVKKKSLLLRNLEMMIVVLTETFCANIQGLILR